MAGAAVAGARGTGRTACSFPVRLVNRAAWPAVQASRAVAEMVLRTATFTVLPDTGHEGRLLSGETPPTE